jgi:hypothetical protein
MSRSFKALIVMLVSALGVWGCAQGTSAPAPTTAERVRLLEARCAKLEEDYHSAVATRDALRKEVGGLLEERAKLEQAKVKLELLKARLERDLDAARAVAAERDQLRGERDALQLRCDRMKKGLQSLLGQDETSTQPAATPSPAQPGEGQS